MEQDKIPGSMCIQWEMISLKGSDFKITLPDRPDINEYLKGKKSDKNVLDITRKIHRSPVSIFIYI